LQDSYRFLVRIANLFRNYLKNASFPDGFSFQVNPVSAEQTKAYVQNAQNLGFNVNTGAFYDVQLLYNGVNASLTSAESMQLQVNFDSPVLTDVKNVTGVGVTNGDVSTDGVFGNTTSLTKTLTADSVGTVGVVALADEGDQDNKQPVEGDETTGGNDGTIPVPAPPYTANAGDATITVNGENLPVGMTFTATDSGEISDDAKKALNISGKTIWFSKQYSVSLTGGGTPGDTNISISIPDTKVGTASVGKEKTAEYLCYYIPENGTAAAVQATITKASDNIYVTGINYPIQSTVNGTYGIVAYRRDSETIQLGENQITNAALQYRENNNAQWKEIPTDGTAIPAQSDIKVKVDYSLGDKAMVVGDTLEYALPDGLTVGTNQTGDITNDANEIIGQYTVGTDKVTLTFYNDNENGHKSFFDDNGVAQEVKGSFYFSGKLSNISTGDGSETKRITIGKIPLDIPVQKIPQEDKNGISISKSVVDNLGQGNTTSATKEAVTKFGDKLIYTLTITAGSENTKYLTGITITDVFNNTGAISKGFAKGISSTWDGTVAGKSVVATADKWNVASGTKKVYWKYIASGQTIQDAEVTPGISGLEYTLNQNDFFTSITPTKGTTQGEDGASVTVPAVMAPGDELVIKYAVDIDPNIIMHDTNGNDINNVKYTLGNSASVETEGGYSASAYAEYVYDKTWLDKRATEINNNTIKYTITANKQPSVALAGWTFKDTLGENEGQQYQNIKVEWFDATDTSKCLGHAEGSWDKASGSFSGGFTVTDNGGTNGQPSFEWKVPSDHTEPYIYRFTYTVNLTKSGHADDYLQQFHNTIQLKSADGKHIFETPTTGGGPGPDISYSRFALTKTQEGVDVANNTISWKTEITKGNTSDYDGTIPAGSVYTDEIPGNVGLHYMTPQQIQDIEVYGIKTGNTSEEKLIKDTDYQIISTEYKNSAGDTYRGFKIKFLTGDVKTPVTIRYKTTANFSGTVSLDFNNKATFKVNGDEWKSEERYVYSFSNLLSKQPGNYNNADKTLTWNLKVNNSGAVSLPAGIKITDIIPSGLEFVKAESKTNGINISVDTTNTRIPVITVNNELERKELNILITTRVTSNSFHEYWFFSTRQ